MRRTLHMSYGRLNVESLYCVSTLCTAHSPHQHVKQFIKLCMHVLRQALDTQRAAILEQHRLLPERLLGHLRWCNGRAAGRELMSEQSTPLKQPV